jgi:lantibiotic leader peptide-processing serine protease
VRRLALTTLLLTTITAGLHLSTAPAEAQGPTRRYIVVSKSDSGVPESVRTQIQRARGRVIKDLSRMGLVTVTSDNPDFARSIPDALAVAPDMRVAGPRPAVATGLTFTQASHRLPGPPSTGDDDFFLDLQWGITAVDAQNAWARGRTGEGVIVAVLDEGVDATHPDLAPNVRADLSTSFAENCTGQIESWQPDPGFYFNHGTHVAGIVAAADNGYGTVGVAPRAQIMAVGVLSRCLGGGQLSWILDGIFYATDHGANIINMSFGNGPLNTNGGCDQYGCYTAEDVAGLAAAYTWAIRYANRQGVTLIAAAGNAAFDYGAHPEFVDLPSALPGVISISATAPLGWAVNPGAYPVASLDIPAYYSNFGIGRIDFAAPGGTSEYFFTDNSSLCTTNGITRPCYLFDYVFSVIPGGWAWASGTSMAAPHAAGVAAQIIGASGGRLPPAEVEKLLRATADHPNGNHKLDPFFGYGRVDTTPVDLKK